MSGLDHASPQRPGLSPWAIAAHDWKHVLRSSWREAGDDNISLIAAGVAFYGFLALAPLLGATVLTYGLVASPVTVIHHMNDLMTVIPADAARLVGDQLMDAVTASADKKGLGLLFAFALALFGARNGAGAIITALNIAYEESEKRSLLKINLLALTITLGAVLAVILALAAFAVLDQLERWAPHVSGRPIDLSKLLSYMILLLASLTGAAALYRFGPCRRSPRWIWLTPGSALTALSWLLLAFGFGTYATHIGRYGVTYGSLAAVAILLTWLYLSSYSLLFGAELNAELEQRALGSLTIGSAPSAEKVTHDREGADWSRGERDEDRGDFSIAPSREHDLLPVSGIRPWMADFAVSRASSRFGSVLGLATVRLASSTLSTTALALLRGGRGQPGVALLGTAAGLAWIDGASRRRQQVRRDKTREAIMRAGLTQANTDPDDVSAANA